MPELPEVEVRRRAPAKNFLMDGTVVVGLGNIYSTEVFLRSNV